MGTWLVVGLGFFGFFWYQPARWLAFSVFPLAYLAVAGVVRAVPPRHRVRALAAVVGLHVVSQFPVVRTYLARPDRTSLLDAARDVAARVEAPGREVVLIGNFGHLAALFTERVRPISGTSYSPDQIRSRIRRWRPEYFVGHRDELVHITRDCRDIVAALAPVAAYRVMENYARGEDMMLLRLTYQAAPPPGETSP
jgi:hypothetical protein